MSDEQKQVDLDNVLEGMDGYLRKWAQGCIEMSDDFYTDKISSIEKLTQIMEGMGYCSQLFRSASVLLNMNRDDEKKAITGFTEDLARIYIEIEQATENEDYSFIVDLVEGELVPTIQMAQELLKTIQQRYAEGIV